MTCKDFSGMIPAFMQDTLDNNSLRIFLEHLDGCKGCREELEIQYLVSKVFDQQDAGQEVNLSKEIPALIEKERKLLKGRTRLAIIAGAFESVAIVTFIATVILYLM